MSMRPSRACLGASLAAALTPTVIAIAVVIFDPAQAIPALFILAMLLSVTLGFPIALIHALFLGLPAYLLFSRKWGFRWWHGVIGGALTGMIPVSIGIAWSEIFSGAHFASLTEMIYLPLYFGVCGAVGGSFFWRNIRTGPHVNGGVAT